MPNKLLLYVFLTFLKGGAMSKKILLQSVINKIIAVLICAWFCSGAFAAQYLNIASDAGDAGVIPGNVILGDTGVRKIGEGDIVFPHGQSYTGPTDVLEGTLINDGTMSSSSVNVASGGTFRSAGIVTRLVNDGSVETGGAVGNFLTAAEYIQHSLSALSIKVSPADSDYLKLGAGSLGGVLKIYMEPGSYPSGGTRYPIVRGGTLNGSFRSIINVNEANVALSYEYDASTYYLVVNGGVPYVPPTVTVYNSGLATAYGNRHDTIVVGSAGGFEGFTVPDSSCKSLHITFMQSGTSAEQNYLLTNAYTGTGEVPYLPHTINDLWLDGDPTGFDILVEGGRQFALPTPAAHTTIHFLLTRAPRTSPLTWFQSALPEGCRLVVEPGSADPYVNTVLPLNGGRIIIGAPVAPAIGFSSLLAGIQTAGYHCPIQRHPSVVVGEAAPKALITLAETTTFPDPVSGISLTGSYATRFNATSDLVDPDADSAEAGFTVGEGNILTIFRSRGHAPLPAISSYLVPGGTSNIVIALNAVALPKLSPPLLLSSCECD
jgi:hypothetical protein